MVQVRRSAEFHSENDIGKMRQKQTFKSHNWLQQGLARISTRRRTKRYESRRRPVDDYLRFFLHVDSEDLPQYYAKCREFAQVPDKLGRSIFFTDGVKKIDYVLVFTENLNDSKKRKNVDRITTESITDILNQVAIDLSKKDQWRNQFLANIKKAGLEIEEEVIEHGKKALIFLKIHATQPVLCCYAEELNLRAPLLLKTEKSDLINGSDTFLKYFGLPNPMKLTMPTEPLRFYTCPFRKNKLNSFLGSENKETYFTTIQRIQIVNEVLSSAVFGIQRKGEVGINRLVHEGVFMAAYPLHDGPYLIERKSGVIQNSEDLNPRQILYEFWARWGRWYKYQPLDHIRNYFGEKVGFYFAWLGFYTTWLFPAAVVGILVFLYGLFTVFDNPYANDVCEKPGKYRMCPQHEFGKLWDLYDICTYIRISYLFDHPGSIFYSIFISFWAVSFLEYWKRKCTTIAYQWDCTDFQEVEEKPRAEYAAKAPFIATNPVTGVREPMFPKKERGKRIATGLGLVFVMISVVIIFIFAIIVFRIAIAIPLHNMNMTRGYAHTMANLTGAGLNFIIIMIMSKFYEWLAQKLTRWEMHRTQSEYDDNYTFKVFVFQFVNFYSSIFYIAFFKGRFVGYPGNYVYIFNMRNEECEEGGCLIELAQQLAIIMIGKQVINNFMEVGVPWVKSWWLKTQVKTKKCKTSDLNPIQFEEDYYTSPNEGLFQEYLEIVLQFGFITLFVAAFPLAPLFALLNNWVEIRLDAQKFVCHTRRVIPERTEDIGMWFKIMQYLAHIAVITNGLLIAFTSRFLMKLLYQYEYNWSEEGYYDFILSWAPNGTYPERCRYRGQRDENGNYTMFFWKLLAIQFAFVLAFEYFVFTVCRLIDIFVADVPPNVEIKIRRERYLAKQALLDNSIFQDQKLSTSKEETSVTIAGVDADVEAYVEDWTSADTVEAKGIVDATPCAKVKCFKSSRRRARLVESQSEFSVFSRKYATASMKQKTAGSRQMGTFTEDKFTQTEEISFLRGEKQKKWSRDCKHNDPKMNLARFRNINKRWTTFPFTSHEKSPKIPKIMTAIPSEDTMSSSSSTSDVFFSPPSSRTLSSFNYETFQKMFFYNALTSRSSSTSKSKLSSLSSRTDSCDREKIVPRRNSLDCESKRTASIKASIDNRKPRPRSWLEPSKSLAKVHLKANKLYVEI